jgi:hypothetical protein
MAHAHLPFRDRSAGHPAGTLLQLRKPSDYRVIAYWTNRQSRRLHVAVRTKYTKVWIRAYLFTVDSSCARSPPGDLPVTVFAN